jgi:hypothetical protein
LVSVEHLWAVLIGQTYIDGISSLVTTLVCVLPGAFVIYAFLYLRRKFKNTPHQEWTQPFGLLMEPLAL